MPDPQQQPGTRAGSLRRVADQRHVIEMLRQARGSVPGVEDSLAALRRRVRQLEDENERLRHGPHSGAA
jgi:hypothetical protein